MFQVKRKFPEHRINLKVEDGVSILKQYYHCDTMFRAQGFLWLCNEIKETDRYRMKIQIEIKIQIIQLQK